MGFRRTAREMTLQFLYEMDLAQKNPAEIALELERYEALPLENLAEGENPQKFREFVFELLSGIIEKREELDGWIQKYATHWKLHRMTFVDRNLLRLAVYELLYRPDIPSSVTLNEAIEIAKNFGSSDSSSFINGVLDHLAKDQKKK